MKVYVTRVTTVLVRKTVGKRPLGRPRRKGETMLRSIFKMCYGVEAWTRLIWLRIGTDGGHL
jgi:hypothetical protein